MSIEKILDMVCGPPGSGKTEFAKWYAKQNKIPVIYYADVRTRIARWHNREQATLVTPLWILLYTKQVMVERGSNQYELLAAQTSLETVRRISDLFDTSHRVVLDGPFFNADEQEKFLRTNARFAESIGMKDSVNGYWMDTDSSLAMERVIKRAIREEPGITRDEIASRIKPLYDNPGPSIAFKKIIIVRSSAPGQYDLLEKTPSQNSL